jgi:hypothetical protein
MLARKKENLLRTRASLRGEARVPATQTRPTKKHQTFSLTPKASCFKTSSKQTSKEMTRLDKTTNPARSLRPTMPATSSPCGLRPVQASPCHSWQSEEYRLVAAVSGNFADLAGIRLEGAPDS